MSASKKKKLRKEQAAITGISKQTKAGMTRFQKAVAITVGVIVALFIIAVLFLNSGLMRQWVTAVSVGDYNVSVSEYNYYYVNTVTNMLETFSSYGYSADDMGIDTSLPYNQQSYPYGTGTWDDQFKTTTNSTIQTTFAYYNEALANGFELSDADEEDIDSSVSEVVTYCNQNGLNINSYLADTYGKGFDQNLLRTYLTHGKIAEAYQTYLEDSRTYTDEQDEAYYEEHKDDIDVVDYYAFSIDGSNQTEHPDDYEYADGEEEAEEDAALEAAQEKANRALTAISDLDSFATVAETYCDEADKETYADPDNCKYTNVQNSSLTSTLADWLFDESRVQGDKTVLTSGTNVIVVMFDQRYREDYMLKNVRHILVQDSEGQYTTALDDEELAELEQQAEDILAEWKAGDATEESFAALADEYSADSSEGGLYENVYIGEMQTEFEDWVFDDSRKPGDTGIIETIYGYHVMYFVGDGEISWKYDVETYMDSEADTEDTETLTEKYPITTHDFGLSMIGD